MKDITVHDVESGLDIHYSWNDKSGYSLTVSNYNSREDMRKAIHLSLKYWPSVPDELKVDIDKYNQEIRDICRSVGINEISNYENDYSR